MRSQRTQLRNGDLKFGEQFQEKALELLVGAVDFVDQKDRRTCACRIDGLQQRPLDQKGFAVQLAVRARTIERMRRIKNPELEQLPRIVPFVQRVPDVQPFIALQPNQIGLQRSGGGRRKRSLADARFPFQEERSFEPEREKECDGETAVGDVVLGGQAMLQIGNGFRENGSPLERMYNT